MATVPGTVESTSECGLCSRAVVSLAQHLVLIHGVRNPEHYRELLETRRRENSRAQEYGEFIAAQSRLREEGLISGEELRHRAREWERSHPAAGVVP